jgi:hypothetical protein
MYYKWTPEEIQFIKDNLPGRRRAEMAEMFNRRFNCSITVQNIKYLTDRVGLYNNLHRKWTPEEIQFIKDNLPGRTHAEMTDMFNKRFGNSITFSKMKSFIISNGFHNGLFKHPKGQKAVGTERISSRGYTIVKVADPDVWKSKGQVIWEAANGPVPEGHRVIFADGNKSNLDLYNLILVSHSESVIMAHQRLFSSDKDLTKAGKALAALTLQIAECEKKLGQRRIRGKRRKKRNEQSS